MVDELEELEEIESNENYDSFDDYIFDEAFEKYDVEALQRQIEDSQGYVDSNEIKTTDGTLDSKLENTALRELHGRKNKEKISKLNAKQLKAIELSINGITQNGIARKLGVSKATVSYWFKNEEFVDMLEKVQKEQVKMFRNHFISQVPSAVRELDKIIRNPSTKDENKLRAISMILDYAGVRENVKDQTNINSVAQIIINMDKPKEISNATDDSDIIDVDAIETEQK